MPISKQMAETILNHNKERLETLNKNPKRFKLQIKDLNNTIKRMEKYLAQDYYSEETLK